MTSTEARVQFDEKLKKMQSAHEALLLVVSEETLREYVDACNAARDAFQSVVVAGLERVRNKKCYADFGKRPTS